MPKLARPPFARASLHAALVISSACVPRQDLDGYRETESATLANEPAPSAVDETPAGPVTADLPAPSEEPPPVASGPLEGATDVSDEAGEEPSNAAQNGTPPAVDAAAPAPGLDSGAPPASSPCATGELLGPNGHCYFFDASLATWGDARGACQARGSGWDLVSVHTLEDAVFLGETLEFEAWIGASDDDTEGTWVWVADGQTFWTGGANGGVAAGAFANWNATEPNGGVTTNCARALPSSFGSATENAPWADLDCAQLLGAACEAAPPGLADAGR